MNEGENTGMSNGAIFSSDNMSSDPIEPIVSTPEMTQPAAPATPAAPADAPAEADAPIFSSDAPAEDMLPEPDLPDRSIITVAPRKGSGIAKLGLGRRFHKKEDKPAAPSWGATAAPANNAAPTPADSLMSKAKAPEYFSEAVEDIAAVDNEKAARRGTAKRVLKIGGITLAALAVIAGIVVGVSFLTGGQKVANARKAWTRFGNYVIYGEEKDDELPKTLDPKALADTNNYMIEGNSFNPNNEATLRSKYKDAKAEISAMAKEDDLKKLDNYIDFAFSVINVSKNISDIAREYASNGKDGYMNRIDEFLAEYQGDANTGYIAKRLANYVKSAMVLVEKYAAVGCLSDNGSINNECLNNNKEAFATERSQYESAKLTYFTNSSAKSLVIEWIKTIMEQLK